MTPRQDIFSWEQAMLATTLPAPTKLVLMVLRVHSNALGQMVWPSQLRIAGMSSLKIRAVKTHLKKAREAGWIRTVKLSEAEGKIAEQLGRKPIRRKAAGRDWSALAYECCFPDRQYITNKQQVQEMHPICRGALKDQEGVHLKHPFHTIEGTPHLEPTINTPLPPKPVDNVDKSGVVKNDKVGKDAYDVGSFLTDMGWQAARTEAPGWDIHRLVGIYNAGVPRRGKPKNADKGFAAWCKAYTKGKRL